METRPNKEDKTQLKPQKRWAITYPGIGVEFEGNVFREQQTAKAFVSHQPECEIKQIYVVPAEITESLCNEFGDYHIDGEEVDKVTVALAPLLEMKDNEGEK